MLMRKARVICGFHDCKYGVVKPSGKLDTQPSAEAKQKCIEEYQLHASKAGEERPQ